MTEDARKDIISWDSQHWMDSRRDNPNRSWISIEKGYCDFDKFHFVDEDGNEIENPRVSL